MSATPLPTWDAWPGAQTSPRLAVPGWRAELERVGYDPAQLPPVVSLTEQEAADYYRQSGWVVRESGGLLWHAPRGKPFWRPVDWLRARPAHELGHPPRGLGYLAAAGERPSTSLVAVTRAGLPSLSWASLTNRRRARQLAATFRRPDLSIGSDPDLLPAQSWRVAQAAHRRVGHLMAADQQTHQRLLEWRLSHPSYFVVTASRDGHLGGYMEGYLLGGTGYLISNRLDDAGLRWKVGGALYWAAFCVLAAAGAERCYLGHWYPDLPNVEYFKRTLGAHAELLPACGRINPAYELLLRRRPVSYVRAGGTNPRVRSLAGVPASGYIW